MRKKLTSALIVIGLLASPLAPANAIFGLSKCEKVKKEMKTIENALFTDYKRIRAYPVKDSEDYVLELTPQSLKLIEKIKNNDPIPKVWKLGLNNPKCFTNTQNIQIKTLQNKSIKDYFDWTVASVFSSSAKCKSLYANGKKYDQKTFDLCYKSNINKWAPIQEYKSIYSY